MPGQITGGPSRRHVLPNQADIDQAESQLQARVPQGYRKPLPPPQPLPQEFAPEADTSPLQGLGGPQALPPAPPTDEAPPPLEGRFVVHYSEEQVSVTLWDDGLRAYAGEGASLTEALSIAAGKLEEGLAVPRCPTCGQVMPEGEA